MSKWWKKEPMRDEIDLWLASESMLGISEQRDRFNRSIFAQLTFQERQMLLEEIPLPPERFQEIATIMNTSVSRVEELIGSLIHSIHMDRIGESG